MAIPLLYDRVKHTTTTTGTGTITLGAAVAGYQNMSIVGNANTLYYCIEAINASGVPTGIWEDGIGTYTSSGTTLSRDTVLDGSSGPGTKVTLPTGTANVYLTLPAVLAAAPRNYIDGLVLSYNNTTTLGIATGCCMDSTNNVQMNFPSAFTKSTNPFVAGTGNGGGFGGSLSASSWYHCFLIRKDSDGSIDFGFDSSVTAASKPAGYTYYRRVGSILTDGSSLFTKFFSYGDLFYWDTPVMDINGTSSQGTSGLTMSATAPPNVKVNLLYTFRLKNLVAGDEIYVSSLDVKDLAVAAAAVPLGPNANSTYAPNIGMLTVMTNGANPTQIRYRLITGDANTTLYFQTHGWIDFRGKDGN